jgi:hypothetical protein
MRDLRLPHAGGFLHSSLNRFVAGIILAAATLCATGAGAQPQVIHTAPPGWPVLAPNAYQAPACVFWTPSNGAPEYFCAVVLHKAFLDSSPGLASASFGLKAVHINPNNGAVRVDAATPVDRDPSNIACVVTPPGFGFSIPSVQCLFGTNGVERWGWNGTGWWNLPPIDSGAGFDRMSFSCLPWSPGPTITTCFGLGTDQLATKSFIRQWVWDGSGSAAHFPDWKTPPNSDGQVNVATTDPLVCTSRGQNMFACMSTASPGFAELLGSGTPNGMDTSVTWTSPPKSFGSSVFTPISCVTFARTDCFYGDGGRLPHGPIPCTNPAEPITCKGAPWRQGLLWMPDDGSRPEQFAMLENFPLLARPSCVGWADGQSECFFPDQQPSDGFDARFANETIWHVISFGLDPRARSAQMLEAAHLSQAFGIIVNPGFWQQSIGIPAPSEELGRITVGNHSILGPVQNPKTLTSFTCFAGPKFQSLCVAGFQDSHYLSPANTLLTPTSPPEALAAYRTTHELLFTLVGNPNGVAPQQPPPFNVKFPGGPHPH